MPFQQIKSTNLAAAAASQLRDLIAKDVLRPGDQLPGERDLAEKMGISRTSLRAGLQTLVAEGLLVSRQGSGLFVPREIGRTIVEPILSLFESSDTAFFDYIGFRCMLEGDSAAIVALDGTVAEKDHIHRIHMALEKADLAGDTELTMRLDGDFHMAIIEATGNTVSIQVGRSLSEILKKSVQNNHNVAYANANNRSNIVTQHKEINDAIQSGDPKSAREALRFHLNYFADLIRKQGASAARQDIVEKRLSWEKSQ